MTFIKITTFFIFWLMFTIPTAEAGNFNAETFTLKNGLKVVVIPNHRAPVVTHIIWYKFGGGDKVPGKSGIAHFLEHLMFKGTADVPNGQFSAIVRKLGGNDNAFTSHDTTAFYQNIARKSLDRVMEMEADRMKNLTLKESDVDSERQVVIEERNQRIDNQPQAKFQEQMISSLFVNHAYGIPILGWMHEIKKLTRVDALESYKKWYAPNNALLVVSGDITAAELRPMAEKYYGGIKPSKLPKRIRSKPAPIVAQHRLTLKDPRIGKPVIKKVYRAPRGSDALEILTEVFGGSSTSRLYKTLVVDRKLAISAGAYYNPIRLNNTMLTLYASPTPDTSLQQLEDAIDGEIRKLIKKGITLKELKNAKSRKKASLTYSLDSLQMPALLFGRVLTSGFDIDYLENWNERIEKLTIDDVNKSASVVFSKDNLPITGILLPQEKNNDEEKK